MGGAGIRIEWEDWESEEREKSGEKEGSWTLVNLPNGKFEHELWNRPICIFDKSLLIQEVVLLKQERLFDEWQGDPSLVNLDCFDRPGIDREVRYWQTELDEGRETYGIQVTEPAV